MSRRRTSNLWFIDKSSLNQIVNQSKSIAEICRKLGLSSSGDQHKQIKKVLNERDIDYSHIRVGLGSNAGRKFNKHKTPLKDILIENSIYNRTNLKKRLIEDGLLQNKCRKCGLENLWQGEEISLHLEHKNGNPKDNRIENLEILCPNCHSQTETYAGKKHKVHYYCNCGREILKGSKSCIFCLGLNNRKSSRPEKNILIEEIKRNGFVQTGKKYGVSDNAIRKWLK